MHHMLSPAVSRRVVALITALIAVALTAATLAVTAQADFGVAPGSFTSVLGSTQAGGATDLTTSFTMVQRPDGWMDGNLKDLAVALPAGFIGDPTVASRCTEEQVLDFRCPDGAAVGTLRVTLGLFGSSQLLGTFPVFNMIPSGGQTAKLGINTASLQVRLGVRVRSDGDYGLTTTLNNVTSASPMLSSTLTLWGVPGDPSHDAVRGACLNGGVPTGKSCSSGVSRRAFLRNSPVCGPEQPARLSVDSWQNPGNFVSYTAPLPDITGCEKLPAANPKASVQPADTSASSPAGYDIDLDVPQVDNPDGVATPPLKTVSIDFPAGTAISPGSADGLAACSDEQLHEHDTSPVSCPDASKIGSVSITTPYLPDPLVGSMYLGQPRPGDQFRLFLVAEGSGVSVRVKGSAVPDPQTGHLTATFNDLPPVAFSHLHVQMKGGPRAVLANPASCGTATSTTTVTPYGGGVDESAPSSFEVGGNCVAPGFAPELSAGTTNPVAGADSPFVLQIRRGDGQQDLKSVGVDLPAGLIGKVAGLPLCPTAAAIAGTCSDASKVGSVSATVGTGSNPITLPGSAYMTEGYNGPFGLVFVVPAVIGPFDFGNVVVRASVQVDPITGALHVQTDDLPSIIAGIPLHYRAITVNLDRPGFMRNPTSCAVQQITTSLASTAGATAAPASRFQVAGCGDLPLAPKVKMTFNGAKEKKKNGHPGFSVRMTQTAGQSNLRFVSVTLPGDVGLSLGLPQPCTLEQFHARACPDASKLGSSSVTTPLLDGRLQGGVYLVEGDHKGQLPRLGVLLNGQVPISLLSLVDVGHGHLKTTFAAPDLPISTFRLTLNPRTALTAAKNLCAKKQRTVVDVLGASGARKKATVTVPVQGCPTKHAKKKAKGNASVSRRMTAAKR